MRRVRIIFVVLFVMLAVTLVAAPLIGSSQVSIRQVWWSLRLPRTLMGMLAGAGLAVAGTMFQAMFRNPLASPYTLGVSSGASLAAAACIVQLGAGGLWHGVPVMVAAAFVGALAAATVVYSVVRFKHGFSTGTLLLAGVTIGFICSALIVLLMYLGGAHDIQVIVRWLMGSLEVVGFDAMLECIPPVAVAAGVALYLNRDLDLLMMGEAVAAGRGVDVRRSRRWVYFAASLMTASVVAHCGPIGFVGLVVPHIMRLLVGPMHRYLLPASALGGAIFLPICDAVARTGLWWLQGSSRQLPVGVLTNLLGGIFFLALLLRRKEETPIL